MNRKWIGCLALAFGSWLIAEPSLLAQGSRNRHSVRVQRNLGQYLTIADEDQAGLDLSGDFTIEAWIKPATTIPAGQEYVIVSKWSGQVAKKAYVFLYYHDGSQPNLRLTTAASPTSDDYDDANIPQTLQAGQWKHVAAVFTAATGTAEYFVNGVTIGQIAGFGNTVNTSDESFEIGTRNGLAVTAFDGFIDEVRVWNVARTPTQIAAIYNCTIRTPVSGLVGAWEFERGYTDSSGNGNTLVPINGAVLANDVPFSQPSGGCP